MAPKSRFTRLDAFTKTVEDARIRTTSGGVVTIVSLLVVLWLAWGEWADYRRIVIHPELVVDKGRGTRRHYLTALAMQDTNTGIYRRAHGNSHEYHLPQDSL